MYPLGVTPDTLTVSPTRRPKVLATVSVATLAAHDPPVTAKVLAGALSMPVIVQVPSVLPVTTPEAGAGLLSSPHCVTKVYRNVRETAVPAPPPCDTPQALAGGYTPRT